MANVARVRIYRIKTTLCFCVINTAVITPDPWPLNKQPLTTHTHTHSYTVSVSLTVTITRPDKWCVVWPWRRVQKPDAKGSALRPTRFLWLLLLKGQFTSKQSWLCNSCRTEWYHPEDTGPRGPSLCSDISVSEERRWRYANVTIISVMNGRVLEILHVKVIEGYRLNSWVQQWIFLPAWKWAASSLSCVNT